MKFEGFDRIVIDEHGKAVASKRTDIEPDVGFMRHDGWAVGAPKSLEDVTFNMWKGEWTHFIYRGDKEWIPIDRYPRKEAKS